MKTTLTFIFFGAFFISVPGCVVKEYTQVTTGTPIRQDLEVMLDNGEYYYATGRSILNDIAEPRIGVEQGNSSAFNTSKDRNQIFYNYMDGGSHRLLRLMRSKHEIDKER